MFTRSIPRVLVPLAVLLLAAACGVGDPESHTYALEIRDRALTDETTFTVAQGDTVTFEITADEEGSFHVHGYDHEVDFEPGEPTVFAFTADATGRFVLAMHPGHHDDLPGNGHTHEDVPLGALDVMPR